MAPELVFFLVLTTVTAAGLMGGAHLLLRALRVPPELPDIRNRVRILTLVIIVAQLVPIVGVVIAVMFYLFITFLRLVYGDAIVQGKTPSPPISLGEALIMVLSLAAFPFSQQAGFVATIFRAPHLQSTAHLYYWINALSVFPLCFACAYFRLNSNRVPQGWPRLLFLGWFPYALTGLAKLPAALILFAINAELDGAIWMESPFAISVGLNLLFVLVGVLLSFFARRACSPISADTTSSLNEQSGRVACI